MKISRLIELLESIRETHGDLEVRAGTSREVLSSSTTVTGIWVVPDITTRKPFVKLAISGKRSGW